MRHDFRDTLSTVSAVSGVMAFILFATLINVPLAILAIISGVIAIAGGEGTRRAARVGIVSGVLSLVMFIASWYIIITHVPTGSFDQQQLQELVEDQYGGEA